MVSQDRFTIVSPDGYDPRVVRNTKLKSQYTVRDLNHQLQQLCRHNREGSFGTQVQRERVTGVYFGR